MRFFNIKCKENSKRMSVLWLLAGALLLLVCNAGYIVPAAPWIAYVFMIRFIRMHKPAVGLLTSLAACMAVSVIINKNAFPLPGIFYYAAAGFFGFVFWVPFIADRLMAHRLKGILSTLVFPVAYVSWEYIYASFSPYLSFGSLAYTQYGILPIMQISAFSGIWGVLFLITWFASLVNWLWERHFDLSGIRLQAGLIVGLYILSLLLGGLSLAVFSQKSQTVRISSVTASANAEALLQGTNWDDIWTGESIVYEKTPKDKTKAIFRNVLGEYINISSRESAAGSKILLWQEGAVFAFKEDEAEYIKYTQEFADDKNVYLFMPMLVMSDDFPDVPAENKVVCIDPQGNALFEYLKSFPVPGEPSRQGDGKMPVIDTPYGRIGLAICFDYDNPMFIRQAGAAGCDIVLNPAYDWEGITPYHAYVSAFRAVENGASLVRCTGHGLTIAYDYQGRVLSAQNYYNNSRGAMVSYVPVKGMPTLYSFTGDLLTWLCLSMFAVLFAVSLISKKRKPSLQKQNIEDMNISR